MDFLHSLEVAVSATKSGRDKEIFEAKECTVRDSIRRVLYHGLIYVMPYPFPLSTLSILTCMLLNLQSVSDHYLKSLCMSSFTIPDC